MIDRLDARPVQVSDEQEFGITHDGTPSDKHRNTTHTITMESPQLATRTRDTRSRAVKQPQQKFEPAPVPIHVEPRRIGPEWKKPLIYPQTGKARATVSWEDLERLNDDEFLNDNLIGMFMRYLQEHMDPELLKKTHFFSSFFYNSLMRPTEKGQKRQINYAAVANWTKSTNLFSRDYVIVPVNESAHWYVMIICNLPSFKSSPENGDEDVIEIDNPDGTDNDVAASSSKTILESDIVVHADIAEHGDDGEGPKDPEQPPIKKRAGKRKSYPIRRQKYSPDAPVIITLDSLGINRSNTASALKDYLVAEAEVRTGLAIEKEDIKGMTAKDIPLQSNFSDCGLYLCMYLEQFVKNPRSFVKSILQREVESFPWPKKLENGALRERLYKMLQDLYKTQAKQEAKELPQIGNILIKAEDYNTKKVTPKDIYEPENVRAGVEYYEKRSQARENGIATEDRMLLDDEHELHYPGLQEDASANGMHGNSNEPIVVEDSQEHGQKYDDTLSRYFRQQTVTNDRPASSHRADTPMMLAEQMRRRRSPSKETARPRTRTQSVLEVPPPALQTSPDKSQATEHTNRQQEREDSVSTDFLTSDRTYQDIDERKQHQNNGSGNNQDGQVDRMQGVEVEEEEEEFNGFADDNGEGVTSRGTSVIPESVQDEDHDMLMH